MSAEPRRILRSPIAVDIAERLETLGDGPESHTGAHGAAVTGVAPLPP